MSVRNRFRHLRKLSKRLRGEATNNAGTLTENSGPSIEPQTPGMPGETILETRSGDIIDDSMGEIELDENGIGNQEEDLFYDAPDGFMSEREPSEPPDSPYSWIDVGTPLPSPPASPLELSDAEDWPEDEDGYENITAEDYREYDCWYAEDSQQELDEMIAETLTEREMDSIKMMAIRMFGHISQRNYERIRYSFREKIHLLTLAKLGTRVARLSGLKPKTLDCCVDSCHAFTLHYADETHCSECKKPRYDSRGRPVQTFQYIPTIPRFQAFFNNPELIKKLLYRHEYVQHNGAMDDFFDSELYKDLCTRNIIIDGTDTGHRFFSGKYDIATTLLTDGVQIFDKGSRETATCWPVMLQILNLPPSDRAKLRNIIPLCVIPGPNKPKDFNSFLAPFVEESLELAKGVETYNVLTGRTFTLREHPVLVSGDMQAIKFVEEMKGVNGVVPCRGCLSKGVYHAERKTYYIPLAEPRDPNNPGKTSTYDPLQLPLRTESNLRSQFARMQKAKTQKEYDNLAKKYGISGWSILDRIPSIKRPTSYPHEFLHLFLLNHGPDLLSLWTNTHDGVKNAGSEKYLISRADWAAIGRETEAATSLLPAEFIRPLPNIQTNQRLYNGESWSFWLIYIGPIVLYGRLPKKYYDHYLELVAILKCLLELSNTTDRIKQLRVDIAGYVERFEEYYYQYDYDRLGMCRLTVHALLHVADDVLRCGPTWVPWSFIIERYCREIVACVKSMVVPYSTVDKHVLQMSQLGTISARFAEIRKALLFGKGDAPVEVSSMECIYSGYPHTILRCPCVRGFPIKNTVRRRLAAYFRTNINSQRTFHEWMQYLPERCERWGKVRIADRGDRIRCAATTNPLSPYGKRDASFVKYIYQRDKNERYKHKKIELVPAIGYGRLDFILVVTLPPNPDFNIHEQETHVLAHITEAKDADGDAATERVSYTELGRSFILDITTIKCAVGRVLTCGEKATGEWIILDRSDSLCPTVFHQDEEEFEQDEE